MTHAGVVTAAAACERVVKGEGAGAKILHFACHGLLDGPDPLASALVLSPGDGEEDGMLRAYEIMERVRLQAQAISDEGVLGMRRWA